MTPGLPTYAARLSASSCRSQFNHGFELVKIWATNPLHLSNRRLLKVPLCSVDGQPEHRFDTESIQRRRTL